MALGGANYRRNVAMLDAGVGKEVPGTKGYKYVSISPFSTSSSEL